VAEWIMEDIALAPTPAGSAVVPGWGEPGSQLGLPNYVWSVNELFVPELFGSLGKAAQSFVAAHPASNLVWTFLGGGAWRNAIRRDKPMPTPQPNPPLPEECLKRVQGVREWERLGYITPDQAQAMIGHIVAGCS
jgi:hypothetical protein